jgi:phasin family protein
MTRTQPTASKTRRTSKISKTEAVDAAIARPKASALDIRGMLEKLKLPGVDVAGLVDSRRQDIEALIAANKKAYSGFEAVTRRQREMFAEAMKELQGNAKATLAANGVKERANLVAEHAKKAFGQALADMKEIAEMSATSQKQVMDTLTKRLRESLSETGNRLKRKG